MTVFLTADELVNRWGNTVNKRTLANWRFSGHGPRFTKLGGKVVYPLEEVIDYEQRRTVQSTYEYDGERFASTR
ncbi:DNA-binding protein [Afifella aestuarii]|uniref:DNA-binding protein n=1 Tax=Afifella aestuarii TaxID=1909496 RepID=UPI000FE2D2E8|nr:DNA-binding protein [Afifella aestuarii]